MSIQQIFSLQKQNSNKKIAELSQNLQFATSQLRQNYLVINLGPPSPECIHTTDFCNRTINGKKDTYIFLLYYE